MADWNGLCHAKMRNDAQLTSATPRQRGCAEQLERGKEGARGIPKPVLPALLWTAANIWSQSVHRAAMDTGQRQELTQSFCCWQQFSLTGYQMPPGKDPASKCWLPALPILLPSLLPSLGAWTAVSSDNRKHQVILQASPWRRAALKYL